MRSRLAKKNPNKSRPREKNGRWKGEDASYWAKHRRVDRLRGKPKRCEWCGLDDPERQYQWANLTGNYDDADDYVRLCVRCHRNYDVRHRITHCPRGHLYDEANTYNQPNGERLCRTCRRERLKAYRQKNLVRLKEYDRQRAKKKKSPPVMPSSLSKGADTP